MIEHAEINGKKVKIRLLFGEERVSGENVTIEDENTRWRFFALTHNDYTAKHFLKRGYYRVGEIINKRKIG